MVITKLFPGERLVAKLDGGGIRVVSNDIHNVKQGEVVGPGLLRGKINGRAKRRACQAVHELGVVLVHHEVEVTERTGRDFQNPSFLEVREYFPVKVLPVRPVERKDLTENLVREERPERVHYYSISINKKLNRIHLL